MTFKSFIAPVAAGALLFSSSVASAAPIAASSTSTASAAAVAGCASLITSTSALASAQAVRPGCVLPVQAPAPVPVVTQAAPSPFLGGWLLPLLGVAGLIGLLVALRGDNNGGGAGSISRA